MTLTTQFMTMAAMIASGFFFGAMLDTYQRFLNRPKRKSWIAFINDILFWAVQALLIFYVLYLVNKGEIRFYIFIALLCGFAAYQALFKKIYLWMLEKVIRAGRWLGRIFAKTVRLLIFKPVTGLIQLAIIIVLFMAKGVLALLAFAGKSVLFIVQIILFTPLKKIFLIVWKVLPKGIKKTAEKLYNSGTGLLMRIRTSLKRLLNRKKE
ncbi:spore cortex biosynthesis protein YabQ [Neobacillus notoginsengisoli]|uniref:Spore cortex biosynthesis protein YabQ n=1 Tax=Neobacillus notoginsengisoli TaxID=1578198 RepID=A0A417YGD1_9BACI|nr:spore cortex biosynthesis protein YabQ [Neobacillus notoginsengisoli]RHW31814.1 spore cortex biosynthesis protein YabQ [Neobacillus notoginsengisoli]